MAGAPGRPARLTLMVWVWSAPLSCGDHPYFYEGDAIVKIDLVTVQRAVGVRDRASFPSRNSNLALWSLVRVRNS